MKKLTLLSLFLMLKISSLYAQSKVSGTVTDMDGNIYLTVGIGRYEWMAENLRVTHYRNGEVIPRTTTDWTKLSLGARIYYGNDSATNSKIYGALYNWFAVRDIRNLAPAGWHIPSDTEWETLTTFLGDDNVAGAALKSAGISFWQSPNPGATNSTGFNALGAGDYLPAYQPPSFTGVGTWGAWWTSTYDANLSLAIYHDMNNTNSVVGRKEYAPVVGFSVRCIKD